MQFAGPSSCKVHGKYSQKQLMTNHISQTSTLVPNNKLTKTRHPNQHMQILFRKSYVETTQNDWSPTAPLFHPLLAPKAVIKAPSQTKWFFLSQWSWTFAELSKEVVILECLVTANYKQQRHCNIQATCHLGEGFEGLNMRAEAAGLMACWLGFNNLF